MSNTYNSENIQVLKGLEAVQVRPGMYTNTVNPLHLLCEILDNAQDEVLAGHGNQIIVELTKLESVDEDKKNIGIRITDNGRGIPVDYHKKEKKPAIQLILEELHSGGKLSKTGAYKFSGGLHGVGASVVNALSKVFNVTVYRDNKQYFIEYKNGKLTTKLTETELSEVRGTGTSIYFEPDLKYFQDGLSITAVKKHIKSKAVLLKNTEIIFIETGKEPIVFSGESFSSYLTSEIGEIEEIAPIYNESAFLENGEGFDLALLFGYSTKKARQSFVNLIHTINGGTHENGLKQGVLSAVREFYELYYDNAKTIKIEMEDVVKNMNFVLSCKLLEVEVRNQTKDSLSSISARKIISDLAFNSFLLYLNENYEIGKKIVDSILSEAKRRISENSKSERKKLTKFSLVKKLVGCTSSDIDETELYLVEGDSAGGSAKQARDKNTQAILALRGKILNTWEVDFDKIFESKEVENIVNSIFSDPSNLDSKLSFGKIIIMSDADVDGEHIAFLLIGLFLKHFPRIIEEGRLFLASPPLFRVSVVIKNQNKVFYCSTVDEKDKLLKKYKNANVSRFKGLGEMNAKELKETTMNKENRRLIAIRANDIDNDIERLNYLYQKNTSADRRAFFEGNGGMIEVK